MNNLSRSLIAAPIVAIIMSLGGGSFAAFTQTSHKAMAETSLSKAGFLDFKTLLYSPITGDDLAGVSNRIKFIGPDTFRNAALRPEVLRKLKAYQNPILSVNPVWGWGPDTLDMPTPNVPEEPQALSSDLVDAILMDITDSIGRHGVSWMLNPSMGIGTAAYFNAASKKVIDQIESLENAGLSSPALSPAVYTPLPAAQIGQPQPQPVLIFGLGLLTIGLLRRRSRQKSRQPVMKKANPAACFDTIRNSPIRVAS